MHESVSYSIAFSCRIIHVVSEYRTKRPCLNFGTDPTATAGVMVALTYHDISQDILLLARGGEYILFPILAEKTMHRQSHADEKEPCGREGQRGQTWQKEALKIHLQTHGEGSCICRFEGAVPPSKLGERPCTSYPTHRHNDTGSERRGGGIT